jgi:hypothetical protein
VPFYAAGVGDDCGWLLRSPTLSEDEAGLEIGKIAVTQLLYVDRLLIELAVFDGIITPSDRPSCTFASRRAVSGAQAP